MMPEISIIVPVYNAASFLEECLDSIVNQTIKNIEIILVDDGSTDDSLDICKRFAQHDSRIRVITQENSGAGVARNVGIDAAQGTYLMFLDSDDFFELDMCDSVLCQARECDADLVLCGADTYDHKKGSYGSGHWILNTSLIPDKDVFNRSDLPTDLFLIVAGGPCNKLFRTAFIRDNGLKFPHLASLEDVPFVYTALALADRIAVVDRVMQHYRRNAPKASLVGKASEYPTRIFDSFGELKKRLIAAGVFADLERSFISRAASDFIDQYYYVLKDPATREFYKFYLARVAAEEFGLSDKDASYFSNKKVYERLYALLDAGRPTVEACDSEHPLVSVILPVYNVAEYLRQCMNSLLNQSLIGFEIIAVDDGSTDDSLRLLHEYQKIDARISVLTQENKHAGAARNAGLAKARGTYLLFLDPDDFFEPTLLEEMLCAAQDVNADVVLCDGFYYNNITGKRKPAPLLLQRWNIPSKKPFNYKDNPDKILHISIDCPWNKLFKKSFINRMGLTFQELRSANDVYFVDCALLLAERITIVDKKLVNYRTNVHTSLQATRAKEPLNFYQALTAVRERMLTEPRYPEIERTLLSLFIAGCRSHLNRARDGQEYMTLYRFYLETGFSTWQLPSDDMARFVYVDDKKWVDEVWSESPEDYLLKRWRSSEAEKTKIAERLSHSKGEDQRTVKDIHDSDDGDRIKYYRSYRIGCAITWLPRKVRGFSRCMSEHGADYTLRRIPEHFGIPAGAEMPRMTKGVTDKKRDQQLIVSLTTFPGRINCVHKAIETLLNQTMKPDQVILWLAREQFPRGKRDLPKSLLRLRRRGLSIQWCDDLKSHKKYYEVMKRYPEDLIITVDDDLYYDSTLIENLYRAHIQHPDCVCAVRCHLLRFDSTGNPLPYKRWKREQSEYVNVPLMGLVSTSGAGTLYPPHCMSDHLFDRQIICSACLNADDLWLKTMQILQGTKTVQIAPNRPLRYVEGSQQDALWHANVDGSGNDVQLAELQKLYGNCWSKTSIELFDRGFAR